MKNIVFFGALVILAACGGGESNSSSVPTPSNNILPIISPIGIQEYYEENAYSLSINASDSDGNIVSYEWVQVSGSAINLTGVSTSTLSFEFPNIKNDETGQFRVVVKDNDGGTAAEIVNYKLIARPELFISDSSVSEGNSGTTEVILTVSINKPSVKEISFNWETRSNTASADIDFVSAMGSEVFLPGETSKSITIYVIGDTLYAEDDPTEDFHVVITNSTTDIGHGLGVVTIENDDMSRAESFADLMKKVEAHRIEVGGAIQEIEIDLHNDGDADIILLNADYDPDSTLFTPRELAYFVNNQGAGFERVLTNIKMYTRFYEIFDVNGDGLVDLISVADHIARAVGSQVNREDYVRLLIRARSRTFIAHFNITD